MKWLSINELAKQTGIPDTTVRRYIAKHSDFFKSKGGTRSKRYEATAVSLLLEIKKLYDEGMETEQVFVAVRGKYPLIQDSEKPIEPPALATGEDMAFIKSALLEQQAFNKALVERLEQQDRYIKESLEARDAMLIESMRLTLESKKQPSFLQKLFRIKPTE